MTTAKRALLALFPLAALVACGDDDDTATTALTTETTETTEPATTVPATTGPEPTEPETTKPATTETPSTTAAPTTTTDPVPPEVQAAYEATGQPRLTPDEYEQYTEVCENLRTDPVFQASFWAADRTDEDRAQVLTNIGPLCPDVESVLDSVKPVPSIGSGTYLAGTEIAPGLYRVSSYWALLDPTQEIIDNELIDGNAPGYSLMNVPAEGVAFVKITGEAIRTDDLPFFDPLAEGVAQGTYLVGFDVQPGTYRVSRPQGAYAARLGLTPEGQLDIIDNDLSDGSVILTVQQGDFAFKFSGALEKIG